MCILNSEKGGKVSQALETVTTTAEKVQRQPVIAHLIRATERFNDRLGNQFGAAITYFSFLSMIPILMVSFAAGGFVLASHPMLLQDIFDKILQNISDPTLAATLKNTINTAVQQRTTVGLVGLAVALYSGINWMGNLREAIRAQSRDVWERSPQDQEKFWVKYLRDFISLIGLLIALIVTLSITSVAGSAQQMIISALHLNSIEWLKPTWRLIGLAISIFANYLLFFWIFWRLYLFAVGNRTQRGEGGDQRFTGTYIALHQTHHRHIQRHIALDLRHYACLCARWLER